jgi:hypothetical protein
VIEVILQHRETGLFLAEEGHWAELSRDALIFMSAAEAFRFARETRLQSTVRAVVRVERDKHYVLMPLLDVAEDATGSIRSPRAAA